MWRKFINLVIAEATWSTSGESRRAIMADQVENGGPAPIAANNPVFILNELLCYVQHHMKRSVSNNIAEVISRHFSVEEISEARDVLKNNYDDNVNHLLKDRRNTSTKAKCVTMAEDIVSAMQELDVKGFETNFVAKNLCRLPKCDPKDLDPYAAMEMILALEDRLKKMESTMGETVARQITQEDDIKYVKESVKTHELILSNTAAPSDPSYKDVVAGNTNQLPPTSTLKEKDEKVDNSAASSKINTAGNDENENDQINSESDDHRWIRVGRNGRPIYDRNRKKINSDTQQEPQRHEQHVQQMHGRSQPQQQQKQQFRRQRKRVQGSREGEALEGAPPPKRDYFLSRVKKETDDEVIINYIVSKGIENPDLKLVSNVDAKYKSYKLSVFLEYKDKVMCADMWPRGVCIERWMEKSYRKGNNNSFTNGEGT